MKVRELLDAFSYVNEESMECKYGCHFNILDLQHNYLVVDESIENYFNGIITDTFDNRIVESFEITQASIDNYNGFLDLTLYII